MLRQLALNVHCAHSKSWKFFICATIVCTKMIYHRGVLCASTANRWWQLITILIVAIADGFAVFSLPIWSHLDGSPSLFCASKTPVLPHFSHAASILTSIGNGFLSDDLADIVMARFVTQRCCHTALNDSVTLTLYGRISDCQLLKTWTLTFRVKKNVPNILPVNKIQYQSDIIALVHVGKYSDTKWWPSETVRCIQHAKAGLCKNVKIHSDMNWWPSETVPLCPAILPKIIWRCQTEKRGSKKFMRYDGWCQFAKKLPLLPNKRIRRVQKNVFLEWPPICCKSTTYSEYHTHWNKLGKLNF